MKMSPITFIVPLCVLQKSTSERSDLNMLKAPMTYISQNTPAFKASYSRWLFSCLVLLIVSSAMHSQGRKSVSKTTENDLASSSSSSSARISQSQGKAAEKD